MVPGIGRGCQAWHAMPWPLDIPTGNEPGEASYR